MKIAFGDIPLRGLQRIIKDDGWSAGSGLVFVHGPEADIVLSLLDDGAAVALDGRLQAIVDALCSRCGCELAHSVDEEFRYTFRCGQDRARYHEDLQCSDEDIETVYLDTPEIDTDEILLEQLILSMPEKLLCKKQCKGVCHKCGAQLNNEPCSCAEDYSDSPFAVLQKLKK
ncbi:MAG: DUF177 domain-containing protein [Desulfopila sp.]